MPGPMGPRPGHTTEKAKDFKGTTKKLIKNYLSKYKIGLIIVFIFVVISSIFVVNDGNKFIIIWLGIYATSCIAVDNIFIKKSKIFSIATFILVVTPPHFQFSSRKRCKSIYPVI